MLDLGPKQRQTKEEEGADKQPLEELKEEDEEVYLRSQFSVISNNNVSESDVN